MENLFIAHCSRLGITGFFARLPLVVLALAFLLGCSRQFGENPREEAMAVSPNYRNGQFQNQIDTPMFAGGTNFFTALLGMFSPGKDSWPDRPLPAIKTDLRALPLDRDAVVWLGHSSYFIILNGKRILVDPVIGSYAAPFPMFNSAFPGTTVYNADDFPPIDVLLITHDHWDHLEYPTVKAITPGKVICPLGVGAHFRAWGYPQEKLEELDWYDKTDIGPGMSIHAVPARHFSGRWIRRNKSLWAGYALIAPKRKIFISGDSGYGPHFREAGENFGGFDLAIIEDGQYDARWPYIHMTPEESAKAAEDTGAKIAIPAHNGRFRMARHAWNEPVSRFEAAARGKSYAVALPIIGEVVQLD